MGIGNLECGLAVASAAQMCPRAHNKKILCTPENPTIEFMHAIHVLLIAALAQIAIAPIPGCIEHGFDQSGAIRSTTCFARQNPFDATTIAQRCPNSQSGAIFRDCRAAARAQNRCHNWNGVWSCSECLSPLNFNTYYQNVYYPNTPQSLIQQLAAEGAAGGQCPFATVPPPGNSNQPCSPHVQHNHAAAVAACNFAGCNTNAHYSCSGDIGQPSHTWRCYAGNPDRTCTGVFNGQGVQTINGRRTHCWNGNRDFMCPAASPPSPPPYSPTTAAPPSSAYQSSRPV